ncbi:MAG: hypothetical protein GY737_10295 [Desulfobacteraceae bacterium]|nr:hypothetical protein [Desulfobacteraceae bacterium]
MYYLQKFLSILPIFSITDDNLFGALNKNSQNKRFSLFRVSFGFRKFYIFTFKSNVFHFFHCLNFLTIQQWPNIDIAIQKTKKYERHINNFSFKKKIEYCNLEKESLFYRLDQLASTKNRNQNKIFLFTTIFLATIPILSILFSKLNYNDFFQIILFFLFSINVINFYLFMYQTLRVKSVHRSKFNDLKATFQKVNELMKSLYFEWYIKCGEIEFEVGVIRNIEKYIVRSSFFLLALMVWINVFANNSNFVSLSDAYQPSINLYIKQNDHKLSKIHLKQLNRLENLCLNGKIEQIIILYNVNLQSHELYKRIISTISLYISNDKIIEISEPDHLKEKMIVLKPQFKK